jgi:protein O-mannosyl-transferase
LTAFCLLWRKRYPLACFGLLMTLILLAPTSSIVPISDPLAERRMYLALVGLILIGCELSKRIRVSPVAGYAAVTAMLAVFSVLCYQRNQLWSQPSALLGDAAMQSTTKVRPYMNLVDELIQERRCDEAIPYLLHADQVFPNSYGVQLGWGRTLECVGRRDDALEHLLRAAAIQPCSYVYQLIGLLYGEMGKHAEAGLALQKAVESDPKSVGAHDAFGFWYETVANPQAAEKEYRTSLTLDRYDRAAQVGIARVRQATLRR